MTADAGPAAAAGGAFDVLVIGSGPGGYVAAIRCAQLGLATACVERESLGGICLNWGCIPTKALLRSAEVLETIHRAKEFGVIAGEARPDFPAMIQRSRGIADKVSKGIGFLFKKNKVTHLTGTAQLLPRPGPWQPHRVQIDGAGGRQIVTAKHVILATGARARSLPGVTLDGERVIEYRKAMTLPAQPRSLIVLGGPLANFLVALANLLLHQPHLQDVHGALFVLGLAALVLAGHDQAGDHPRAVELPVMEPLLGGHVMVEAVEIVLGDDHRA